MKNYKFYDYPVLHAFQNVNAIDIVKKGCSKGQGILKLEELITDETTNVVCCWISCGDVLNVNE